MIAQPIPIKAEQDWPAFCGWVARWGISVDLGVRLVEMQANFPGTLKIFSGRRSEAQQDALREEGRPTADNDRSTHLDCPAATGADVTPVVTPMLAPGDVVSEVTVAFGLAASKAGLRWGGGGPIGPTGIPRDWKHVDLGPRRLQA